MTDLVLSSGFLAFGAQAGFLAAVEDAGVPVDAIVGTSSGALAGALWAAGLDAQAVLAELSRRTPLQWASWRWTPWRGVLGLDAVIAELRTRLPATFDGLERPFAVGVATGTGHELITSGPLPEAVAASCAIPWVFASVALGGRLAWDGGVVDRTAVDAWRRWRPGRRAVLHLVDRSHGTDVPADLAGLDVVRSPRSGASLWSLGPVEAAFDRTRAAARDRLG